MKKRIRMILFAVGMTLCLTGQAALAEETTEALTEFSAISEEDPAAAAEQYYLDSAKTYAATLIEQLAGLSADEVRSVIEEGSSEDIRIIAAVWDSNREELGSFKEIESQEAAMGEDGKTVTVVSKVKYDGVSDKTNVLVTNTVNVRDGSGTMSWDVKYPMSKLVGEAGLNTLLGIGIVFIVLLFLSFIIGQIHWIPDLLAKGSKKTEEPAKETAPSAAPAAAAAAAEEELSDDEELVAVIAAAIAASEGSPSTDGFVVRSIRKARR